MRDGKRWVKEVESAQKALGKAADEDACAAFITGNGADALYGPEVEARLHAGTFLTNATFGSCFS